MNRWVLDILCCPVCKGSFILSETKDNGTEISEGKLTCSVCGKCYPIENGIANLLPENLR
ncbi:MAG TPA: methytransferase partner Trm112 [Methanocorpusculum sp.]|nr:methytransferase partner Trm112 [Methanocorpusculum sp.]